MRIRTYIHERSAVGSMGPAGYLLAALALVVMLPLLLLALLLAIVLGAAALLAGVLLKFVGKLRAAGPPGGEGRRNVRVVRDSGATS